MVDSFNRQTSSGTFHPANKAEIKPLINQSSDEASYRQVSVQRSQDRFQVKDSQDYAIFLPTPPLSISSGEHFHHDLQHLPCYHHHQQHNHQLCQPLQPQQQQLQRLPAMVAHNPYHTLRPGERRHHKNVTWCLHDDLSTSDLSTPDPESAYHSTTLPRTAHSASSKFKPSRPCDVIIPEDSEVPATDFHHRTTDAPQAAASLPAAAFSKNSDIESLTSLLDGSQSNVLKLNHVTQSPSISDVGPQSKLPFTKKTLLTDV